MVRRLSPAQGPWAGRLMGRSHSASPANTASRRVLGCNLGETADFCPRVRLQAEQLGELSQVVRCLMPSHPSPEG